MKAIFAVFILFWGVVFGASGQEIKSVVVDNSLDYERIADNIYVLEDAGHALSPSQAMNAGGYVLCDKGIPDLGITNSAFWVRVRVKNKTDDTVLSIQLSSPTLDSVTFYERYADGTIRTSETGEAFPFIHREELSSDFQFRFILHKNEQRDVFFKVSSNEHLLLPLVVGTDTSMSAKDKYKDLFWGVYIGLMLAMLFYNFFVYTTTHDKSYLYYIVYVVTVILAQITISGYGFQLIWSHSWFLAHSSTFLTPALVGIAGMEFMRHFLLTHKFVPKADKFFFVLYGMYAVAVLAGWLGQYTLSYNLTDATAGIVAIYMLVIAFVILRKGYRPARFFLLAWIGFLVGVFVFVFKNFSVLPYNNLTVFMMPIGSAVEVILLSFALADKINTYRKEKETSQANELRAVQENERLVKQQNIVLEQKVEERTKQLSEANEGLKKAMKELKDAETQLVEQEKMASLGQLTAGIAHEINNPINFVTSNVNPLNRDVRILIDTVAEIEQIAMSDDNLDAKSQKINNYKEEIDYPYLMEEIDMLLNGIKEGASRTAEIVKGLRIFSRLDEDDLKRADVNEGLDSTLVITNNLIGNNIIVRKNYANLPLIECYPGKLNQVFLNMISNAVYAIKKKFGEKDGGVLSITTECDNEFLYVKIGDNGTGMDAQTKKRLFEPFYTTKEVGEGTGLGMSIAYNTINKHNGRIEIVSEVGVGTEFIIVLPFIQK